MFRSVLRSKFAAAPAVIFSLSSAGFAMADVKPTPSKEFFDSKGLPAALVWESKTPTNLSLVGVGMRRKNLYVTMVDVYQVGAYLSPSMIVKANEWKVQGKPIPFSDVIVPKEQVSGTKSATPKASITLKFVRDVGNQTICDAFKDAFAGCTPDAVKRFQDALNATIGASDIKKGEEIYFIWMETDEIVMAKNGVVVKSISDTELANRLVDVYFDPKRSVSPDLIVSFDTNIELVKA